MTRSLHIAAVLSLTIAAIIAISDAHEQPKPEIRYVCLHQIQAERFIVPCPWDTP